MSNNVKYTYKRTQLDNAIKYFLGEDVGSIIIHNAGRVEACHTSARKAFINKTIENLEAEILRSALNDLETDGMFNFDEENE